MAKPTLIHSEEPERVTITMPPGGDLEVDTTTDVDRAIVLLVRALVACASPVRISRE